MARLIAILVSIFIYIPKALAEISDCDGVLIQNHSYSNEYSRENLALLKLVTSDNFDDAKTSANGKYNLNSGSYEELKRHRQTAYNETGYNRNSEQARAIITSTIPSQAIAAWRECMAAKNKGLYAYVSDESDNEATVRIVWNPIPGLPSININVDIDGTQLTENNLQGEIAYTVRRNNPLKAIRGIVTGKAGSGNWSTTFIVPGRRYVAVSRVEAAGNIPNQYIVNGTTVDVVAVNTPENGDISNITACTAPFPTGYFVDVDRNKPTVIVSGVDGYPVGQLIGLLIPENMSGEQTEICFLTQCGYNGRFTTCRGRLSGKIKKRITEQVLQ